MSQAKVATIADTEEYKEFELRHNRHLNMVGESVSISINISLFY